MTPPQRMATVPRAIRTVVKTPSPEIRDRPTLGIHDQSSVALSPDRATSRTIDLMELLSKIASREVRKLWRKLAGPVSFFAGHSLCPDRTILGAIEFANSLGKSAPAWI